MDTYRRQPGPSEDRRTEVGNVELLNDTVTIFKENQTRAELYKLWLDEFDVRIALTKSEAAKVLDGTTGVAIVGREFGDGDAPKLLEVLRARTPYCRVVVTRDRADGFPGVDPDQHLITPVFKGELRELVTRLLGQVNYRIALVEYYRAAGELASMEFVSDRSNVDDGAERPDDEREAELERRVGRLKRLLGEYRGALDRDDIAAVMQSISFSSPAGERGPEPKSVSKYHPTKCSNCGRNWDVSRSSREGKGFSQLGAFVWRCVGCGHVHMQSDPSHQRVGSYER